VARYFLDLPGAVAPVAWDPHAGPRPERADTRYFGAAFTHMERALDDPDVDVYLTWDVRRLPGYGSRVVAVVLGDEGGRIPRYLDRVRAVFKCYGTRPASAGLADLPRTGLHWLRWLPGAAALARVRIAARAGRGPGPAPVLPIPLGTYNQLALPVLAMADRPTDVFFAGSLEHTRGTLQRLASPKVRARREMLVAVQRLGQARPGLRIDVRLTPGFDASVAASPEAYSRALMDARVCLAPRGTSPETFRVLEGLRCGCVVVTGPLPDHWFYRGAPLVRLDRWADLPRALPALDDQAELDRRHAASLAWWHERCSEAAVGRWLAQRLNEVAPRPGSTTTLRRSRRVR
jgi:hypothetical protein